MGHGCVGLASEAEISEPGWDKHEAMKTRHSQRHREKERGFGRKVGALLCWMG